MSETVLACAVVFCCVARLQAHSTAEDMRSAAIRWLEKAGDLKSKAVFELKSAERENWNFVPMPRKGASLGEMNARQRQQVHELLQTALSHRGYLQATTIVSLELVLKQIEKSDIRDPGRYYLSIFGEPGTNATWGWRFEGHHLSLNFLITEGQKVSVAPSFFGSNPAESGTKENIVRPLAEEEDLARAFVRSLDKEQQATAIFSETAPRDIITGTKRMVSQLEPPGIAFGKLSEPQKQMLKQLIAVYVNRYRSELAQEDLQRIENAGWETVSFAWAGGLEKGQGHYYRAQGPTFLLEYDNTQNHANHIHTVWRDRERDFGGDLLKDHYQTSAHHKS